MITNKTIGLYARVSYEQKEIIEKIPFSNLQKPPFVSLNEVRKRFGDKMKADLEAMKVSRAAEVKASVAYALLVKRYQKAHLMYTVEQMRQSRPSTPYFTKDTDFVISSYLECLSFEEICSIKDGNCELLDKEVERIFNSDDFLVSNFLFEEFKEEAEKLMKAYLKEV